uniref:Transcription factor IIIB subunit n=2 Tax=Anthurium amnicola TaxID=1678845 RepID=A0A1D1ZC65_9ARAE
MPWCKHCQEVCPTVRDEDRGYICCQGCGRVLDQDIYYSGVTFEKTSSGQSRLAGAFIRSVQSEYSLSHERTLMKGRDEIKGIVVSLSVAGGDSIIDQAHALYKIAVERNFTRGRITSQVAAACLYIACRQNTKPYLLIDFSDFLQINVYVLGAVFLQLCQLLRLEEHPIVQKPVDSSLFIHRFAERLLGEKNSEVIKIALRIIARMKRDWMQTGRKPSGLCGAALYIAALSQGLKYSKQHVRDAVYVCEATLTKRLIEFENTKSGSLTIEEILTKADEVEADCQANGLPSKSSSTTDILCEHKDHGGVHFAHGLCKECYDKFVEISGGLQGGSEPPAFQHAERRRMEMAAAEEKERDFQSKFDPDADEDEVLTSKEPRNMGSSPFEHGDVHSKAVDEEDSLSDIDDIEVAGYLLSEEHKNYKKIIWETVNKDFIEEQAAKEAAAAAAKEAYDATFANCSDEIRSAQELAAASAAAAAKSRKERKQKRAEEAKNSVPARTAAEATRQMLKRKAFSSKINYEALDTLFTSDERQTKKQHLKSDDGDKPRNHRDDKANEPQDSVTTNYHIDDNAAEDIFEGDDYVGEYDNHNYGDVDDYDLEFY